jgi:hypothetical protein
MDIRISADLGEFILQVLHPAALGNGGPIVASLVLVGDAGEAN